MIAHFFSLITLVLIFRQLQSKVELFSINNRITRIALIILSVGFSILYFIWGILSISKGFSIVSLFKMEYGLFFVYSTYKLYISSRVFDYQFNCLTTKNRLKSELDNSDANSIDQLIRDTLICMEDDDFEKAQLLIDKVDTQYTVDQNIVLLKKLVNKTIINDDVDYSQSFCF